MSTYVLIVLIFSGIGGSPRPVMIVQEFSSQATCEAAKESVRNKVQNARVDLLTCEKK
jgi:hypothetical protein